MKYKLMDGVKLLREVKRYMYDFYDIEAQNLRIEIDSDGMLKFFSGDELLNASLLELDLDKGEHLILEDLISALESDYDHEIRQYLFDEIEKGNAEISTADLKKMAGI